MSDKINECMKGLLDPVPTCVFGGLHTPTRNSQMPAGCRRTQINSDTVYLEMESDSTGKGLSPTRQLFTSDSSCKPRFSPVLLSYRL